MTNLEIDCELDALLDDPMLGEKYQGKFHDDLSDLPPKLFTAMLTSCFDQDEIADLIIGSAYANQIRKVRDWLKNE